MILKFSLALFYFASDDSIVAYLHKVIRTGGLQSHFMLLTCVVNRKSCYCMFDFCPECTCFIHVKNKYHCVYAPSLWEMVSQYNAISHWLGAYTQWSLTKLPIEYAHGLLLTAFLRFYMIVVIIHIHRVNYLGAVSIRKTVLPGMAIPMLKIRRPYGRLIFNMEIAIRR